MTGQSECTSCLNCSPSHSSVNLTMNSRSAGDIAGSSSNSFWKSSTPSHPSLTLPKCASSAARFGRPRLNASSASLDRGCLLTSSPALCLVTDNAFTTSSNCDAALSRSSALPFCSTLRISTIPTTVISSPGAHLFTSVPSASMSANRACPRPS